MIYRCRCEAHLRLVEVLEFGGSRFHLACLRCGFVSRAVAGVVSPETIEAIPAAICLRDVDGDIRRVKAEWVKRRVS